MTYRPNETVYCRFTREAFTVVEHYGAVVTVRDAAGNVSHRIVGDITDRAPPPEDDTPSVIPMDLACLAYVAEHDGVVPTAAIPAKLFVGAIPADYPNLVDRGLIEHFDERTAITAAGRAALSSARSHKGGAESHD